MPGKSSYGISVLRLGGVAPASFALLVYGLASQTKLALLAYVQKGLSDLWIAHGISHFIAHVEQAAVVATFACVVELFRWRDVIRFIDIFVALASLAKGRSQDPDLDAGAFATNLVLAHIGARCWLEYVESDSNRSDQASRLLADDPRLHQHGFIPRWIRAPVLPWFVCPDQRVAVVKDLLSGGR